MSDFYIFDLNIFIENWKPYGLQVVSNIFKNCANPIPYWAEIEDLNERTKAINSYCLFNKLEKKLPLSQKNIIKNKI